MSSSPPKRWFALSMVCLGMFLQALSIGFNAVLFPVLMESSGMNTGLIGLILSCEIITVVIACLILGRLFNALGILSSLILATSVRTVATLMLAWNQGVFDWILYIFLVGIGFGVYLLLVQVWTDSLLWKGRRSLLLGIFGTSESLGLAIGPLLFGQREWLAQQALPLSQSLGLTSDDFITRFPFFFSAAITLLSLLPLLIVGKTTPKIARNIKLRFRPIIKRAQAFMLGTSTTGAAYYGITSFIVIYGIFNKIPAEEAALLLVAFTLGGLILDAPLSSIADKVDSRYVFMALVFMNLVCSIFLPITIYDLKQAIVLLFVWGGVVGSMYTICMAVVAHRYTAEESINGHCANTLMDNLGGTLGALLVGVSMYFLGSDGLPYAITFFNLLYFCYALTRYRII